MNRREVIERLFPADVLRELRRMDAESAADNASSDPGEGR